MTEFSDIDFYVICSAGNFLRHLKNKEHLQEIKNRINPKIKIHLVPKFLLRFNYYDIIGIEIKRGQFFTFKAKANPQTVKLNSLKLCYKYLLRYKLSGDNQARAQHLHDLQKNYFFLTKSHQRDWQVIENSLEKYRVSKFPTSDWILYCLKFRKILPRDFENSLLKSIVAFNSNLNTGHEKFLFEFNHYFGKIEKSKEPLTNPQEILQKIEKYIFIIFII